MKMKILTAALILLLPLTATAQLLPLMANQMVQNRQQAVKIARAEQGNKPLGCGIESASPSHEGALTACITGQHRHGSKAVEAGQIKAAAGIVSEAKEAGGSGSYSTMTIAGIKGLDTLEIALPADGKRRSESVARIAKLGKDAPRPVSILVYGSADKDRDVIEAALRKGYPNGEINVIYSGRLSVVFMEGG